jgi:hypothetical protein
MGPKMASLTELRRKFVYNLMNQPKRNATAAAEAAGYSAVSRASLMVQAHLLLHDSNIQDALVEETERRLRGCLPAAVATIAEIMENPQEGGSNRLKAAEMVMDRSGLHAVSETIQTDGGPLQEPDRMKRIIELARSMNMPVEKLIGRRLALQKPTEEPLVLEGEYEEMSAEGIDELI